MSEDSRRMVIDNKIYRVTHKKNRKFGTVYFIAGNRKQLLLTETLLKQNKNTNVRYGVQNAFIGQLVHFFFF